MSRILVVANRTLGSTDLLESIRDRMTKGPCEFTLLVPATAHAHRESTMETLTRRIMNMQATDEARGAADGDNDLLEGGCSSVSSNCRNWVLKWMAKSVTRMHSRPSRRPSPGGSMRNHLVDPPQ